LSTRRSTSGQFGANDASVISLIIAVAEFGNRDLITNLSNVEFCSKIASQQYRRSSFPDRKPYRLDYILQTFDNLKIGLFLLCSALNRSTTCVKLTK